MGSRKHTIQERKGISDFLKNKGIDFNHLVKLWNSEFSDNITSLEDLISSPIFSFEKLHLSIARWEKEEKLETNGFAYSKTYKNASVEYALIEKRELEEVSSLGKKVFNYLKNQNLDIDDIYFILCKYIVIYMEETCFEMDLTKKTAMGKLTQNLNLINDLHHFEYWCEKFKKRDNSWKMYKQQKEDSLL